MIFWRFLAENVSQVTTSKIFAQNKARTTMDRATHGCRASSPYCLVLRLNSFASCHRRHRCQSRVAILVAICNAKLDCGFIRQTSPVREDLGPYLNTAFLGASRMSLTNVLDRRRYKIATLHDYDRITNRVTHRHVIIPVAIVGVHRCRLIQQFYDILIFTRSSRGPRSKWSRASYGVNRIKSHALKLYVHTSVHCMYSKMQVSFSARAQ